MADVHVGDIGTVIRVTVMEDDAALDIAASTTQAIVLRKPSGDRVSLSVSFTTDGSDGKIQYVTAEDDLDESGKWLIQAEVELAGGTWHSEVGEFYVQPNL